MKRLFRKRSIRVPFGQEVFTSLIGGSEGGLATTSAIIAGLLISTHSISLVITTASIAFIVQAFNGAVGRFSSERTNDEIEQVDEVVGYKTPIIDALAQLSSHLVSGAIVISPLILIDDAQLALISSISLTLSLLFVMGAFKAKYVKNNLLHEGFEMMVLGAMVISVGIVSGWLLR